MKIKFFKEKKKFDPYEESIMRTLARTHKKVTPTEIADYLGIHPNTVKKRIEGLEKKKIVECKKDGKFLYCSVRKDKLPKDY